MSLGGGKSEVVVGGELPPHTKKVMNLHRELPLQKLGRYTQAMEARIIETAKSNGGVFGVSPRYRDDAIRSACHRLKKQGIFKQTRYGVFESFKLKVAPNK